MNVGSQTQYGTAKQWMNEFDENKDGQLKDQELEKLARKLGITKEQLLKADGTCDSVRDGALNFCELQKAFQNMMNYDGGENEDPDLVTPVQNCG